MSIEVKKEYEKKVKKESKKKNCGITFEKIKSTIRRLN